MSQLTDKYGDVYIHAQNLGVTNLNAQEENGHITVTGNAPTQYIANQVWDKVKEIDPDLKDGDLTLNLNVQRQDIYGEHEVKSGDTLSSIANKIGRGSLTYQQIFDANRDILSDPDKIQPGQRLKIPNFTAGQKA
ncbi:MAG TPA: LysM peptidoglycan-binding domain-containing protein [Blastocatellia bacterium]|nr:LysM peptidoglycan-binding domain-containing protein [Blastocatellia bacterium]